jgi:hypothetical protein
MARYNYPAPISPEYKKPTRVEDCLPQARTMAKKAHGRAALGPVKRADQILIVTYPDQDKYVKEAITQALEEEGAEKVDFINEHELTGKESIARSVENGWGEAERLAKATPGLAVLPHLKEAGDGVRKYLDKHPEYTGVFMGQGGRSHVLLALGHHDKKFRNNWVFNNWEEFISKSWSYPDELWKEIERPVIEALGKACRVRITDPEGTYLEYPLKEEEALRFQKCAWLPGHLFLDPLQATSIECCNATWPYASKVVPPVFHDLNGVLAGTANHFGFLPRIELYFEHARLVEVKGGGKYGDMIKEMMDKYKDAHWPGYPDKGFFWFCDSALCTVVKAFRRTSDMFNSYWPSPNIPERNRAGIFHHGFGSRRHFEDQFDKYAKEHNLPHSHIHIHNYFSTYEIKLRDSGHWLKVTDKGHLTTLDDPKIRTLAVKYGDPDELLSIEWVPPVPGINCEGDYFKDYAPDPMAYLKKRMKENKPI